METDELLAARLSVWLNDFWYVPCCFAPESRIIMRLAQGHLPSQHPAPAQLQSRIPGHLHQQSNHLSLRLVRE